MKQNHEPGISAPDEVTVPRLHRVKATQERSGYKGARTRRDSHETDSRNLGFESLSRLSNSHSTTGSTEIALNHALLADEATRAHGFAGIIGIIGISLAPVVPLLGGDPLAKFMCIVSMIVMGNLSLWIWYITRDLSKYNRGIHRVFGYTLITGVMFVEYYFGFFSPVVAVVTLGIYHFGQSTDRLYAFIFPIYAIVSLGILATLTALGILQDRGLFLANASSLYIKLFSVFGTSLILSCTFWLSRFAHRSMTAAIQRSNKMLVLAQNREALLAEARHQLDHALRLAIGKPGRYTGAIAGSYRLGIIIGIGAMGEVYEAEQMVTKKSAAVKLLQANAMENQQLFERFSRESNIGRLLTHPNLVEVYEVGHLEDDSPYIAMEKLEGEDLDTSLRKSGSLLLDEVIDLAESMAAGLHHAHHAGVIHRDLKPHNLFHSFDPNNNKRKVWKILDFGISKLTDSTGSLTQDGAIGTPRYMSPEQAKNTYIDHRSDIFSMAVVLYRALTGRPAFSGQNTPQVMFDIVYRNPVRPSNVKKGIPRDVEYVLAVGLAKNQNERFQSAIEFAAALGSASEGRLSDSIKQHARNLLTVNPWGHLLSNDKSGSSLV